MSPPAPLIPLIVLLCLVWSTSAFLLAPPSSAAASARAASATALGLFGPPATKAADGSFLDSSVRPTQPCPLPERHPTC